MDKDPSNVYIYLNAESELRFEVNYTRKLSLELIYGLAEMFGAELLMNKRYEFKPGSQLAVFSWHGCSLVLSYRPMVCYVAHVTPMPIYSNCHAALESMRFNAKAQGRRGPAVLVVGPSNVGKSSLCQLLLNYAARTGQPSLYVDLDPGLGHVSVPGTVCALPVWRPSAVGRGFDRNLPLVLHYGHFLPESNPAHFKALVSRLAEHCFSGIRGSRAMRNATIVIDTCGTAMNAASYGTVLHIARAFEIEVVLVVAHDKLHYLLTKDLPDFVKVVALPKSGGVAERSIDDITRMRDQSIQDYFYGWSERSRPSNLEIRFDQLKLYTMFPELPSSCLPIGKEVDFSRKLLPVKPTADLLHHLLAITYTKVPDEKAAVANVMGFVYVASVDLERRIVGVVSPQPDPNLANYLYFVSDVQFFDSPFDCNNNTDFAE